MAEKGNNKILVIIFVVIIIAIGVWMYYHDKKKSTDKRENFTSLAASANDNVGMLLDDQYDLLPGADNEVPAPHFADLVDSGNLVQEYASPQPSNSEGLRPMERLHRVQGKSLMPRVSTNVTPFNVDVANPTSHMYMVNTPRVSTALKSRYKDYSLASFIRGDIPITYYPNVPLVAKTHQGRDDLRLDGLFTPQFVSLYNKYTGKEYKNLVTQVAGAGQAGGYGGASGGTIMDHQ